MHDIAPKLVARTNLLRLARFRFSLRTLMIAIAVAAMILALAVLAARHVIYGQRLNFEALLSSVDKAIGKRFQSLQMGGMESATYQYDGPMQTVLDIVAPIARRSGFTEVAVDLAGAMGAAEQEMPKQLNIDMQSVEQRVFTHPSGDTLAVMKMHMSNKDLDMKMIIIQLMNPKKMADFGETMKKP
jgi:hypothetical protein